LFVIAAVTGVPVAAASRPAPVSLLDLRPSFVKARDLVRRNRTVLRPGLFLVGKRYRGLNVPSSCRIGFDLDGVFESFEVTVGVLDGGREPIRFRLLGDGQVLAATPPLFPGAEPVRLRVDLSRVLLLELESEVDAGNVRGNSRGGFVDGLLQPAEGKDLKPFRIVQESFDEADYPYAFRKRVNEAIDAAARHLLAMQGDDGAWRGQHPLGTTALMTLACLKAGIPRDHPAMRRAFEHMAGQPLDHTYSVSILLMALEARWFPGGASPKEALEAISEADRAWIRRCAEWLVEQQGDDAVPVWRYPRGVYDLSNTQYALFGLSAANRCGVATGRVWLPALKFLLEAQESGADAPQVDVSYYVRDGRYLRRVHERARPRGFGYVLQQPATGSMTTAGICSLVLCQQALERNAAFRRGYSRRTRDAIRDGLAWLEEYYEIEENPFRARAWWTYYLFNLERTGVLLDLRYIGVRDWYEEGAERLMAEQDRSGRIGENTLDTAFALLFLKRATVPAKTNPLR
jgi:hypothetical protein